MLLLGYNVTKQTQLEILSKWLVELNEHSLLHLHRKVEMVWVLGEDLRYFFKQGFGGADLWV